VSLARFRVHLPGRRAFWEVRIFRTQTELREFYSGRSDEPIPGPAASWKRAKNVLAFARALQSRQRNGRWAPLKNGRRGLVCFCLTACGVGVASHEWTHAALYEFTTHQGRRSLSLRRDDEAFALLQGELVRRFWLAFQRRFQLRGRQWVRRRP
jgi:hypothetical protein